MEAWWKETVFYQIYMPSFCDGNQDGMGDFKGISSKLPYLKKLGVGGIWLTPFYPSPKVDQGYDISDYYSIDPDYGTMEDFSDFLSKAHMLGIKVIADMVINHTSTEHPWFLESKSSRDNTKRDWYVWEEGVDGKEPNNWESFFGEKAWEFQEETKMYYYHSFAKEQADLNWANPEVKKAIFHMLDYWVEKGLDGFRLDVINNLTLTRDLTDNPYDIQGNQIHAYDVNQKGIHEFMKELKGHFGEEFFLVGEISSDELEKIHSYTGREALDTTFNFNLGSMEKFDFTDFYKEIEKMTALYDEQAYPTIFFGSHDMPRFPTRFDFSENQAKCLFALMMTYRGIPFLYFGDEIGMKNFVCHNIAEARDIQGRIAYAKALEQGKSKEEALFDLNKNSRDHSRNTMYWEDTMYGGFSEVMPWIPYQKQQGKCVDTQIKDENSLLSYVAKLCKIRTSQRIFAYGTCSITSPVHGVILCKREYQGSRAISLMNFTNKEQRIEIKEDIGKKILIESNQNAVSWQGTQVILKPEHAVILL